MSTSQAESTRGSGVTAAATAAEEEERRKMKKALKKELNKLLQQKPAYLQLRDEFKYVNPTQTNIDRCTEDLLSLPMAILHVKYQLAMLDAVPDAEHNDGSKADAAPAENDQRPENESEQ